MHSTREVALLFLILLLGVSSYVYVPRSAGDVSRATELAAVLAAPAAPLSLDAPTKTKDCAVNGALPDHACTPGAIFPDATLDAICTPGYTKKVRNVSTKLHKQIYAAYGIAYPPPYGSYELDHLIPLELGGDNDASNLFPEAASPSPGFHEKDLVENYLNEEVCAGRVALSVAQVRIADDWLSVYDNLSAADIARLKAEYRSWVNAN